MELASINGVREMILRKMSNPVALQWPEGYVDFIDPSSGERIRYTLGPHRLAACIAARADHITQDNIGTREWKLKMAHANSGTIAATYALSIASTGNDPDHFKAAAIRKRVLTLKQINKATGIFDWVHKMRNNKQLYKTILESSKEAGKIPENNLNEHIYKIILRKLNNIAIQHSNYNLSSWIMQLYNEIERHRPVNEHHLITHNGTVYITLHTDWSYQRESIFGNIVKDDTFVSELVSQLINCYWNGLLYEDSIMENCIEWTLVCRTLVKVLKIAMFGNTPVNKKLTRMTVGQMIDIDISLPGILIDVLCCDFTAVAYLSHRLEMVKPVYQLSTIITNMVIVPKLCCLYECSCDADSREDVRLNTIFRNPQVYGQYGECTAAISHCWREKTLVQGSKLSKYIHQLIQETRDKVWLDLNQNNFDAQKCRLEYTKRVYIISRLAMEIGHALSVEGLMYALMLSDWGERGWVAQEVRYAKELFVITNTEIINMPKDYADLPLASISAHDLIGRYNQLSWRRWSKREDIIKSAEWWGTGIANATNTIRHACATAALQLVNGNAHGKHACWLPREITTITRIPHGVATVITEKYALIMTGDVYLSPSIIHNDNHFYVRLQSGITHIPGISRQGIRLYESSDTQVIRLLIFKLGSYMGDTGMTVVNFVSQKEDGVYQIISPGVLRLTSQPFSLLWQTAIKVGRVIVG